MSFETLDLAPEILRAVTEQGYTEPTPIQRETIPIILKGQDIMAGAQTGTGKTAAFTLPLLHHLSKKPQDKHKRFVRALILTPTRELAAQVHKNVCDYGRHLHLKSAVIFGGVNIYHQKQQLSRGVDIVVATPGRLLDHVGQKTIDLSKVEFLVLDEADRMLDMGFIHDIRKVISILPKQRQNLLFFATFSDEIKKLAHGLLKSPALIEVAPRNTAAKSVTQIIHPVDRAKKGELLSFLIGSNNWKQVLVFTRTKHVANKLAAQLTEDGLSSLAIHGNKSQGARTRALEGFKNGTVRVLVATDLASRGLNIDQLPHVVNFELPEIPEDYVHRIGRTGRAGNEGEAISLVCVDELKLLQDIEQLLKITIPHSMIPGYEPDPSIKPKPIRKPKTFRGAKKVGSKPKEAQFSKNSQPKKFGARKQNSNHNTGKTRRDRSK